MAKYKTLKGDDLPSRKPILKFRPSTRGQPYTIHSYATYATSKRPRKYGVRGGKIGPPKPKK